MRVIFVCLGNICRSPLAEGVFRNRLAARGLSTDENDGIPTDSAGLGDWHAGSAPDKRSIAVAKKHGIDITSQRARKIVESDFENFDFVVAMDRDNVDALKKLCPTQFADRIHLLMSFVPNSKIREVPDPYFFRDEESFARVYAVIADGVDGLISHLDAHHALGNKSSRG